MFPKYLKCCRFKLPFAIMKMVYHHSTVLAAISHLRGKRWPLIWLIYWAGVPVVGEHIDISYIHVCNYFRCKDKHHLFQREAALDMLLAAGMMVRKVKSRRRQEMMSWTFCQGLISGLLEFGLWNINSTWRKPFHYSNTSNYLSTGNYINLSSVYSLLISL